MDTTKQIQRFPFKSLGSGNSAGAIIAPNTQFSSFPYKSAQNKTPENNIVEEMRSEVLKEPSFSEKELYAARQNSYEEGYSKGYISAKSAEAEIEKQIQVILGDINIKLVAVSEAVKARNNQNIKEMANLVIRIARKVAGEALKLDPYSEIESIIRESLPLLFDEPAISIAVSPDIMANIETRIKNIMENEGFKNIIEINANSALSLGSCEIQWNGGGLRSNKDELWAQIEKLCETV
jgi:flagellar biosynthesis/type III secretory pathway protein FliH